MIGTYEGWVAKCDNATCRSEVRGKSKHALQEKVKAAGWQTLPGEHVLCCGCVEHRSKRARDRDYDFFCPNKCGTALIGEPDWVQRMSQAHLMECG